MHPMFDHTEPLFWLDFAREPRYCWEPGAALDKAMSLSRTC